MRHAGGEPTHGLHARRLAQPLLQHGPHAPRPLAVLEHAVEGGGRGGHLVAAARGHRLGPALASVARHRRGQRLQPPDDASGHDDAAQEHGREEGQDQGGDPVGDLVQLGLHDRLGHARDDPPADRLHARRGDHPVAPILVDVADPGAERRGHEAARAQRGAAGRGQDLTRGADEGHLIAGHLGGVGDEAIHALVAVHEAEDAREHPGRLILGAADRHAQRQRAVLERRDPHVGGEAGRAQRRGPDGVQAVLAHPLGEGGPGQDAPVEPDQVVEEEVVRAGVGVVEHGVYLLA